MLSQHLTPLVTSLITVVDVIFPCSAPSLLNASQMNLYHFISPLLVQAIVIPQLHHGQAFLSVLAASQPALQFQGFFQTVILMCHLRLHTFSIDKSSEGTGWSSLFSFSPCSSMSHRSLHYTWKTVPHVFFYFVCLDFLATFLTQGLGILIFHSLRSPHTPPLLLV